MRTVKRLTALVLAVNLLLGLVSCGGSKAAAATMHLIQTEGTVGVADGGGKDVTLKENLNLYSGYRVDTRAESYAWINLDDVKLTKMDQNSDIAIKKEDKHLEIEVKSGNLFFNVTEPLAEDETLEIRTSSMVVGIRGTCGWVEAEDSRHMNVYLLEGTVECSAGGQTAAVSAGEMVQMTEAQETPLVVQPFSAADVRPFVQEEADRTLLANLPAETPSAGETTSPNARIIDSGTWEDLVLTSEDIIICGTAALGNVTLTSGNVTIYGSPALGNVTTTSGNVTISGSPALGNVSTTSGNVTIDGSPAVGTIRTDSGTITVSGNAQVGHLTSSTGVITDNR